MGGPSYSHSARSVRTETYSKQSFSQNFTQQDAGEMHASMNPAEALIRESRDNEHNPLTVPIIFGEDGTGSMDYIPKHMVVNGLPTMISKLQEKGVKSPAILFMMIGDSRGRGGVYDKAPLQVGQFESGDEQLDMWLTRGWIEGGGWGNGGESYAWAWWFAANRCQTDHWDKRGEKGFIFTVGDDACHDIEPWEFKNVLNIKHEFASKEDLLKAASEKWNVYHFCLRDNERINNDWKKLMGENAIMVKNHEDIPALVASIVSEGVKKEDLVEESLPGVGGTEFKITL